MDNIIINVFMIVVVLAGNILSLFILFYLPSRVVCFPSFLILYGFSELFEVVLDGGNQNCRSNRI